MPTPRSDGAAIWVLTSTIAATALTLHAALVFSLAGDAPTPWLSFPLIAVAIGFGLAEIFVIHVRLGRNAYAFSLSEIPLVVGLFFVQPDRLILARLGSALVVFLWRRTPLRKAAFNLALFGLEATVAVIVWRIVLAGAEQPLGPSGWIATLVVAFVTSVLGSGLVSLAIAIDTHERPLLVSDIFSLGQVIDLVNAVFALVVVYVVSVDWRAGWMLIVVILVLVLAHRGYERLQGRTESLEQINRFTGRVGSQLDVDAVVREVLTQVGAAAAAEVVEIRLPDASGEHRDWALVSMEDAESGDETRVLDTFAPLITTESLLVPRSTKTPALRGALQAAGVRDFLAVQLRVDGHPNGTLAVADRVGDLDTFTDDNVRQLEALANHAGVALANASRADLLRQQAAEREHQATHDDLTGLVNRRKFGHRLDTLLADGRAAVLLLDLDRFKEVNDTLGHQIGDDLLCLVARRLTDVVPTDALVARFGGDEFAVLLPGADEHGATACASLVTGGLSRPFDLDGMTVAVDASIGVAVAEPGTDAVTAVRWADVAMYAAKKTHRGVEVYRPEIDSYDPTRVSLLADLRDAIAANAFTLMYQPKVEVGSGAVQGVEALVRWKHPRHGPVGPDDFIPLAEHSGLITPLTMLVLRSALDRCATWREEGLALSLAVNISTRSLLEPTFVDQVARILSSVPVPPSALTLEITETSLMAEPELAIAALRRLRVLGVRLSVDDLGTGYSSLAYLQRLPVDEIKIDKSFLQAMPDPAAEAVIGAIIDLGHRLDRTVVAEGVENEAAWHRLRALGCDTAQGYWICRPAQPEAIAPFVEQWHQDRPPTPGGTVVELFRN